jgi:glutamate N-acetyltransferase/amino-acid N-acetyltransferase
MATLTEAALGLLPRTCAVMSTGVIGPRLPLEKINVGVRTGAMQLSVDGWDAASRAIMTTDTRPKVAFRYLDDGRVALFGMAKGAGMIHPNMATMLSVIVTDAAIGETSLDEMLRTAVDASFNCISVDGDTSTNDTVLILANGAAGPFPPDAAAFASALTSLCTDLAQQIVRDGEGATKFITIRVTGAASDSDARTAAKAIANSPLVKTAFYGGDANWGRILAAVGYSGATVDPGKADLWIAAGRGEVTTSLQLVHAGQPLPYSEEAASAIFAGPEISVVVDLGLSNGQATVWTCDLSHDYVDINGHYRT